MKRVFECLVKESDTFGQCVLQAEKLAFHATMNFLDSIRDAVVDPRSSFRDGAFSEFLGLAHGGSTTLCFIVDTTGSMAEEIEAVRQFTININEKANLQDRPSDYLLSPFNDYDITLPGIGYTVFQPSTQHLVWVSPTVWSAVVVNTILYFKF